MHYARDSSGACSMSTCEAVYLKISDVKIQNAQMTKTIRIKSYQNARAIFKCRVDEVKERGCEEEDGFVISVYMLAPISYLLIVRQGINHVYIWRLYS